MSGKLMESSVVDVEARRQLEFTNENLHLAVQDRDRKILELETRIRELEAIANDFASKAQEISTEFYDACRSIYKARQILTTPSGAWDSEGKALSDKIERALAALEGR